MNSLPPISHHLFVAAIEHDGRGQVRPRQNETSSTGPTGYSHAAPLQVVDDTHQSHSARLRPLRMSAKSGGA